jgi:hypothetical protein
MSLIPIGGSVDQTESRTAVTFEDLKPYLKGLPTYCEAQ